MRVDPLSRQNWLLFVNVEMLFVQQDYSVIDYVLYTTECITVYKLFAIWTISEKDSVFHSEF